VTSQVVAAGYGGAARWAAYVFAVTAAVLFSRAMQYHLAPSTAAAPILAVKHALFAAACVGIGLYLLPQWRTALALLLRERSVLVLAVLLAASPLWSDQPRQAAVTAVGMLGATAFGVSLAVCHDWRERLGILAVALSVVMLSSLVMAMAFPEAGLMQGFHEGMWRGAYSHKNMLGKMAMLSGSCCFCFALLAPRWRRPALGLYWFALLLLLLSFSRAGLACWLLVFAPLGVWLWWRGQQRLAVHAALGAACVLAVLALQLGYKLTPAGLVSRASDCAHNLAGTGQSAACGWRTDTAKSLQRPPLRTMQTRGALWRDTAGAIAERPLLGYGPGMFWRAHAGAIRERFDWLPLHAHAHNGLLDLALDLGLAGLAATLLGAAAAAAALVARGRRGQLSDGELAGATLLLALLLANIAESRLLGPNNLLWPMWVMVLLALCRDRRAPTPPRPRDAAGA